ncbi:unnamed protein product [Peniophora sp. CBMAI 1063]|nr:unnamed protein product [Peniophora sp. CBMAI 1063]
MAPQPRSYGEIADAILPSIVLSVRVRDLLSAAVGDFVALEPREHQAFFKEQMGRVWDSPIDWKAKPQGTQFADQWSALKRFFKEQGRMRGSAAVPDSTSARRWTALRVCGVVYREGIDRMIFVATGMRPGDRRGYLGQRSRCRTVYFWKLPRQDRQQMMEIARRWNRSGPPAAQKMKNFSRKFRTYIRQVHVTALRDFGQHVVTIIVPEVGMFNPPRVYDFFQEFGLMKQPLVKEVEMTETLKSLFGVVNRATGQLDEDAYPAMLQAKSRLKRKITYRIQPQEHFVGRDELRLDSALWDEEVFYKEAIPMVYRIVTTAHANISKYRDLDPVWTDWEVMVDDQFRLEGIPMQLPTTLGRDKCFQYLRHWFNLGRLKFRKWRRKNSMLMDPVDMSERWWIDSYRASDENDGDAATESLDAPPGVVAAMNQLPPVPSQMESCGHGRAQSVSPYGSAGAQTYRVHGDALIDDESLEWMEVPPVSDPDDLQLLARVATPQLDFGEAVDHEWSAPAAVPTNPEAMAQWCLHHLEGLHSISVRIPRHLKRGICKLAELPLVPNGFFSLRAASKYISIPDWLRWSLVNTPVKERHKTEDLLRFMEKHPWTFQYGGQVRFSGFDMAWCFALGSVLYLEAHSTSLGALDDEDGAPSHNPLNASSLSSLFQDFEAALDSLTDEYSYPGCPPSTKYSVVTSRSLYLAYLLQTADSTLIELLRLTTMMGDGERDRSVSIISYQCKDKTWMSESDGIPSWHWPRCGLPNGSHLNAALGMQIRQWLSRQDLLVDLATSSARTRETGLSIMLKAALIYCDLHNLQTQTWDQPGAEQLRTSSVLGEVDALHDALVNWASLEVEKLRPYIEINGQEDEDNEDVTQMLSIPPVSDIDNQGAPVHRRFHPLSTPPPSDLAGPFQDIELDDLGVREAVGDFRADLEAEPLSAAQVYSRRGLEQIADEPEQRRMNREKRALRDRRTAVAPPASRRAAPARRPSATHYWDDDADGETAGQPPAPSEVPVRRGRGPQHPRAPRIRQNATGSDLQMLASAPSAVGVASRKRKRTAARPEARKPKGKGSEGQVAVKSKSKGRRNAGKASASKPAARRRGGAPIMDPDEASNIKDGSSESDEEMPSRITRVRSSARLQARTKRRRLSGDVRGDSSDTASPPPVPAGTGSPPAIDRRRARSRADRSAEAMSVYFAADATTTSGVESDELELARSPMPHQRERLLFVAPGGEGLKSVAPARPKPRPVRRR